MSLQKLISVLRSLIKWILCSYRKLITWTRSLILLHILLFILTGTAFGQAPTKVIDGHYCRDSIAESQVINLHQKAVLCDSLLGAVIVVVNTKNEIIEDQKALINKSIEEAEKQNKRKKLYKSTTFVSLLLAIVSILI